MFYNIHVLMLRVRKIRKVQLVANNRTPATESQCVEQTLPDRKAMDII